MATFARGLLNKFAVLNMAFLNPSKMKSKLLFPFLLSLFCATYVYAQTGSIKGRVTETFAGSTEPVIGAIVNLEGTSMATVTDTAGRFYFDKVTAGKYDVKITYVGYSPKIVKGVDVISGETASLNNIRIEEDVKTTEEVEIIGTRDKGSDVSVIAEIKTLDVVASGIGNEQIKRTLDRDAADVAKRVSGVTVVDNRFVIVRGLSDRYNAVMLNNALAPSFEQDVKSFSLDNLPSQYIDRMVVYKSPSPDLPGDFAGGVVKIYTHGMPQKNNFNIGFSSSYRQGTTFQDFKSTPQGKYGWLGYDDGTYGYPKGVPYDFGAATEDKYNLFSVGKLFKSNTWLPTSKNAQPDTRFNINSGFRINLGKGKLLGITSGLNYSNTFQKFHDAKRASFVSDGLGHWLPGFDNEARVTWDEEAYQRTIRIGAIQNFNLHLDSKNSIEFKNLYSHVGTNLYRNLFVNNGFNEPKEISLYPERLTYHSRTSLWNTYGGIYSTQLSGKNTVWGDAELNWLIGYNKAQRDQPDVKNYEYNSYPNSNKPTLWGQAAGGAANPYYFSRYFFSTNEDLKTASADISKKISLDLHSDPILTLKSGFYTEEKRRQFALRAFAYSGNARAGLQSDGTTPAYNDGIFNYDNLHLENLNDASSWDNPNGLVVRHSGDAGAYQARTTLFAYYGMAHLNFKDKLLLSGGMRLENYTQVINNHQLFFQNWLPSVNASYNVTKKFLVRSSFGKTVNRPEIREAAPIKVFDFYLLRYVQGNIDLRPTQVNNFDFRLEYYPSPDEVFSIGLFNKQFREPIERQFVPDDKSGGNPLNLYVGFANAHKAYSRGIELEAKKSLRKLLIIKDKDILSNVAVLINAAIIQSEVRYAQETSDLITKPKPLLGQSPYMINAAITYNSEKPGILINLSYNVIGKRLIAVLQGPGNIYEMPRNVLDLTISKRLSKYCDLKFGIQDLINQKIQFMQDVNGDGKVKRVTDTGYQGDYTKDNYVNTLRDLESTPSTNPTVGYIVNDTQYQGFRLGRYYSLGITFKF